LISCFPNSGSLRALRFAVVCLIAFALLAPSLFGLAAFGQDAKSSCGMSCCKKTKMSACHHAQEAQASGGPLWTAAVSCPKDCGQGPALRIAVPALLARTSAALEFATPRVTPWNRSYLNRERAKAEFALFQRPPPFHS
jgi:hypothetical protein